MAIFNKFQPFVEAVAEAQQDLATGQLVIALTNAANPPLATNGLLGDLTQIAYTNLSSRNITTTDSSQTGGTYKLTVADLTLTASGGPVAAFRYIVVYNDTAAGDPLIGFYDYGADLNLNDGESLLIDFDQVNGLLQIA